MNKINLMMLKTIWGFMFLSLFFYTYLTFFLIGEANVSLSNDLEVQVFYLLGTVLLLSSSIVPRMILKPLIQTFQNESLNDEAIYKMYFSPFVLKIVLLELITLLGFLLSVTNKKNIIIPFVIISVVGFVLCYPTRARIRDLFTR